MRMNKGNPFLDTPADYSPEGWEDTANPPPTFSEVFLYATVGKGDARFILGVAEEYAHIIDALGPRATKALLSIKPRLVRRLGVPRRVYKAIEDALSDDHLRHEREFPPEVVLDHDAARSAWEILHAEYRSHFNPEKALGEDQLRAYNALTEGLGRHAVEARQKERDRLPEKLAKQEERRKQVAARREARHNRVELIRQGMVGEGRDPEDAEVAARQAERALREEAA